MRRKKPAAQRYLSLLAEPVPRGEAALAVRRGAQRREGSELLAAPVTDPPFVQDEAVISQATARRQPGRKKASPVPAPYNDLATAASGIANAHWPVRLPDRQSETASNARVETVVGPPESHAVEAQTPTRRPAPAATPVNAKFFSQPPPVQEPQAKHEAAAVDRHTAFLGPVADRAVPAPRVAAVNAIAAETEKPTMREYGRENLIDRANVAEPKVPGTEGIFREPQSRDKVSHHPVETSAMTGTRVRIGTVEIRNVIAQPSAAQAALFPKAAGPVPARVSDRPAARTSDGESLSRSLAWSYGLVQG
jgi:hypothetical protein